MGIPSYFSYIIKHHPHIIQKLENYKINNKCINNLYLDCNSIIYNEVHLMSKTYESTNIKQFEQLLLLNICKKIQEYIKTIQPSNTVFIAFDGVAPMAKLKQQRNRRYKSWFESEVTKQIDNASNTLVSWNTTAITPGTSFMKDLGNYVSEYFSTASKFGVSHIIVSSSLEPGEGEHKLFEYIRNNIEYHKNRTTVIYGLDADLIMLCINHLPIVKNLYLFRETPHFIKTINRSLDPDKLYYLNIPVFATAIIGNISNQTSHVSTQLQNNRIYDYIFLCFFLGNDFMPHFPALNIRTNGMDYLMNAYTKVIGNTTKTLISNTNIIWKNVRMLIEYLSENEEMYIKKEYNIRTKWNKRTTKNITKEDKLFKFQSLPIHKREVELYINPFNHNWKHRYYKLLFNIEPTEARRREISINYLEGLEWTMKYYTDCCHNWRWTYRYDYPPLLCDLIKYIPYFNTTFIVKQPKLPIHPLVQLCYVLPRNSLDLLPNVVHQQLLHKYPEWYVNNCEFIWAFCKYFWESHVLFPEINITQLETLITNTI